jgi:hypothetical protein
MKISGMQAVTSPAYSLPTTFTVYVAPSETPGGNVAPSETPGGNGSDDGDEDRKSRVASGSSYSTFTEFCKFLKKEARIACNLVTFQRLPKNEETKKISKAKVFAVYSVASQTTNVPDSETRISKKIS